MNEKIKELAEQAGLQSSKDEAICFAEMIIKECGTVIEEYGLSLVGKDEHYLGETLNLSIKVQEATNKIKQHFGIAE